MDSSKRKFLKTTCIASVTLFPVARTLSRVMGKTDADVANLLNEDDTNLDFHLIDNNLMNLHFYFVNVKKRHRHLVPASGDASLKSFMIVRIPQMHLSERGFFQDNWTNSEKNKPHATLSGYSYLAFRMWPRQKSKVGKFSDIPYLQRRLFFSLHNVTDWNNQSLELISLVEWFDLKGVRLNEFKFSDYINDCEDFKKKKIWNKHTDIHEEYAEVKLTATEGFRKYQSIVKTLLDNNLKIKPEFDQFIPITFFEVPQGLCLVPIVRDDDGALANANNKPAARFRENLFVNQEKSRFGKRRYEVWNNILYYESQPKKDDTGSSFRIETPSFRAMGIIGEEASICYKPQDCSTQKAANTLPSLLNKMELAFLTQYAKGNGVTYGESDFRESDFDINELNGFFFTGLGIITHLKYYNVEKRPPCIDLIEYEHVISQGRDVHIKVSRLGYNTKTGKKYKHVIEAKRKIDNLAIDNQNQTGIISFLDIRQYCEPIDESIDYTLFPDQFEPEKTSGITWEQELKKSDFQPMSSFGINEFEGFMAAALDDNRQPHYRRFPFRSLHTKKKDRIPIVCLTKQILEGDICTLENEALWFWPLIESCATGATGLPAEKVPLEWYLTCEYEAEDWEKNTVSASTPFMFIRASALEGAEISHCYNSDKDGKTYNASAIIDAMANYFMGKIPSDGSKSVFIERRKTYINRKFIAFSPALALSNDPASSKNKPNKIETEFFDSYFVVRSAMYDGKPTAAQKIKYIVLPQLLRFKGYTDHVKSYANCDIPQMFEYHENFVSCRYDSDTDFKHPRTGKTVRNYGTLAFAHTEVFMGNPIMMNGKMLSPPTPFIEEQLNDTYGQIKTAISESKSKLGNLVIPDIIPDTISLEKFGITVPKDINKSIQNGRTVIDKAQQGLNKIQGFNPRELLRGKLSDVCGLDLTMILDELIPADSQQNQTPLFEINKMANQISDEIQNSEVYAEINGKIEAVKVEMARLENACKSIKLKIDQYRLAYNAAIKELTGLIPDADDLRNVVMTEADAFSTAAFMKLEDSKIVEFIRTEVALFTHLVEEKIAELGHIEETLEATAQRIIDQNVPNTELKNLMLRAVPMVKNVVKEYKNRFFQTVDNKEVKNKIEEIVNEIESASIIQMTQRSNEVNFTVGTEVIYYNETTLMFEKDNGSSSVVAGKQPFKVLEFPDRSPAQLEEVMAKFSACIARNLSGNAFQHAAANALGIQSKIYGENLKKIKERLGQSSELLNAHAQEISKWLKDYKNDFESNESKLDAATRDAIVKVKSLLSAVNPYIGALQKIDPYFYYTETKRIEKEIRDVKDRIQAKYLNNYKKLLSSVYQKVDDLKKVKDDYANAIIGFEGNVSDALEILKQQNEKYVNAYKDFTNELSYMPEKFIQSVVASNPELAQVYNSVNDARKIIQEKEKEYKDLIAQYRQYVQDHMKMLESDLSEAIADFILAHPDEIEKVQEAQHLYRMLTAIKQQELTYNWNTTSFRDINLGVVAFKKFSNPNTELKVDVKGTTYFSPGKFPPVVEKITYYSENRFSNFGINFFNCLTIGFNEISFITASDQSPHFDIKIKDVKFDGALSFVQAFEKWLQTMGKGLILSVESDHVGLGYSLAIPAIKTPGFNIFNLSLNLDLRVYFDSRPLRLGFSLARPDSKFGIAVGIYAGFGFFGIVADPKKGIVEIDCALEAGAWAGISLGPISGEVKLAFGFRYTKNEFGVRIEGYIVAEGRLKMWILEISARIYLGVVSQNSYVEGMCTVTYSVKLGFIKKSFSGTFHKKIAGANRNNNDASQALMFEYRKKLSNKAKTLDKASMAAFAKYIEDKDKKVAIKPVSEEAWEKFITIF